MLHTDQMFPAAAIFSLWASFPWNWSKLAFCPFSTIQPDMKTFFCDVFNFLEFPPWCFYSQIEGSRKKQVDGNPPSVSKWPWFSGKVRLWQRTLAFCSQSQKKGRDGQYSYCLCPLHKNQRQVVCIRGQWTEIVWQQASACYHEFLSNSVLLPCLQPSVTKH